MNPVEEVIFSDAHLDRAAWNSQAIRGDSLFSLSQIIDYAIANRPRWLLGLGDMIDVNRPHSKLPVTYAKEIARLPQETRFGYTEGQHELSDPPWLEVCERAEHLPSRYPNGFRSGSRKYYAINWTPAEHLPAALAAIPPDTDTLLCHQVWTDFMGTMIGGEGAFSDIPAVSRVFTGDYHVHKTHKTVGKDGQELTVYSPGSTNMREISEESQKFFYVVRADGSVESVKLRTRVVLKPVQIVTESELLHFLAVADTALLSAEQAAAKRQLPEEIAKPLWRIHYSLSLPDAFARIRAAINNRAHLFLTEIPPTLEERFVNRKERLDAVSKGLLGCLELLVPDTKSRVYQDAHRLLSVDDYESEVERLCREALDDSDVAVAGG